MVPRTSVGSPAVWIVALGAALSGSVAGCVNTKRGDTLYRVRDADLEEEKVIRRKLWHVGKAVEDVRMRYALEDITVAIIIADLGGLGETTPAFSGLASVSGAKVVLSKRLFLEQHPDMDMVIVGLVAHEMMHALHYARMQKGELIELGRRYSAMMRDPEGPQRKWVRAYERLTDMMAIKLGYGEELIYQKAASEANLGANDPPQVWDFYLTEAEIRAMIVDEELLDREMNAAIDVLNIPSARALRDIPVVLDEHGDLVPLRRR